MVADVSCKENVDRIFENTLQEFGTVDILVNNAGIATPIGLAWKVDPKEWLREIQINLGGCFLCTRTVLPVMIAKRSGKIINVGSSLGVSTTTHFSGYCASKAGVIHFTRAVAQEVGDYGINVNCVGVNAVTRMSEVVSEAGDRGGIHSANAKRLLEAGGGPCPEENTALVVFLASPASDHITGEYIECNRITQFMIDAARRNGH